MSSRDSSVSVLVTVSYFSPVGVFTYTCAYIYVDATRAGKRVADLNLCRSIT